MTSNEDLALILGNIQGGIKALNDKLDDHKDRMDSHSGRIAKVEGRMNWVSGAAAVVGFVIGGIFTLGKGS